MWNIYNCFLFIWVKKEWIEKETEKKSYGFMNNGTKFNQLYYSVSYTIKVKANLQTQWEQSKKKKEYTLQIPHGDKNETDYGI